MNKNLSLAIEKAVEKINPKDNFLVNQKNADKKPDLFSLTSQTELFQIVLVSYQINFYQVTLLNSSVKFVFRKRPNNSKIPNFSMFKFYIQAHSFLALNSNPSSPSHEGDECAYFHGFSFYNVQVLQMCPPAIFEWSASQFECLFSHIGQPKGASSDEVLQLKVHFLLRF